MWKVNIACALRWRVASVRITLLGMAYHIRGKTFQVKDLFQWMVLIWDRNGEESRRVAFIITFVIIFVK